MFPLLVKKRKLPRKPSLPSGFENRLLNLPTHLVNHTQDYIPSYCVGPHKANPRCKAVITSVPKQLTCNDTVGAHRVGVTFNFVPFVARKCSHNVWCSINYRVGGCLRVPCETCLGKVYSYSKSILGQQEWTRIDPFAVGRLEAQPL